MVSFFKLTVSYLADHRAGQRVTFFALTFLFCSITAPQEIYSQDTTLVLSDTFGKKIKEFKIGSAIYFKLKVPPEDSLYKVDYRRIYGRIVSIHSASLNIIVISDELYAYSKKEGLDMYNYKNQNNDQPGLLMNVKFDEIIFIKSAGKSEKEIALLTTVLVASIGTSLIVAPLASINYNNGDINSQSYYNIAGYSLVVSGLVSLWCWLTSPGKGYQINSNTDIKQKNNWTISYGLHERSP